MERLPKICVTKQQIYEKKSMQDVWGKIGVTKNIQLFSQEGKVVQQIYSLYRNQCKMYRKNGVILIKIAMDLHMSI